MGTRCLGGIHLGLLLVAACGDDRPVVGVSWNNFQQARWAALDKPALQAAIEAAGGTYIDTDANLSTEQQLTDVQTLLNQGADVLIILAQDSEAIRPAVQQAVDQGVPVLAYDRLIEDERTFYISFDNVEVGRMQARGVFEKVPIGNYVIIKGDPGDPNAHLWRSIYDDVLHDALASGDVVI